MLRRWNKSDNEGTLNKKRGSLPTNAEFEKAVIACVMFIVTDDFIAKQKKEKKKKEKKEEEME